MTGDATFAAVAPLSGYPALLAIDTSVLEAIPAAVYVCAADGLIVRFNRRAAELWGRAPKVGDTDARFCGSFRLYNMDGTLLPHARTPMAEALRTGRSQRDKEVVIERPDGSRIVASVQIDPLKDSNGRVQGAINCFQDITERKRADEEIRSSRSDLEDFFENAVVPMHWVNGAGVILRANRAELDLLGYTCDEYIGRHVAEFHADQAKIEGILASLSCGESLDKVPAQLRAKDGSIKDVLISSSAHLRDGQLVNTRCVTLNVTDAKRAESMLRDSERRSRELLNALPVAVYTTDVAGWITYYNQAAAELWGYRPELGEAQWCGSWRLYWPDGTPLSQDECPMALALKEERPVRGLECVVERPDGSRVPFLPFPTPLRDASGNLAGAVNMLVDISDRKRAEEALAKRLEEQAALYEITDRLHRAESLSDVYDSALDTILRALPCQRASILLFDESGVMRFVAWRGLSDAYRQATDGHSPWTPETRAPQPISVDDVESGNLTDSLRATIRAEGIGALAFIPLVSSGGLIGKFMSYYDAPHTFTDAELDLAVAIGRQLGFGVERMRAEEALRQSEARESARSAELRTIMEAVPAVIWIARDPECRVMSGNRASYEFLRLSRKDNPSLSAPDDERPRTFEVLVDGRSLAPGDLPVQRAARGEEVRNFEHETRFNDGTSRYLFGNATPLRDAEGNPCGAVAAFVDITDRKKAEEQRQLLLAELSHRVKNTLATVISIAEQSFAKNANVDEARRSFASRIRALAQTHSRLAEVNWSGVSFEALLHDEFAPYYREEGRNVRISGPAIAFDAKCALTLGMTIHELATNAAKYGALSLETGSVDVAWHVDVESRQLRICWSETGGPIVRAPGRSGFGRLLIERALAADLGSDVQLEFAEEGLRCDIAIPLDEHVVRLA